MTVSLRIALETAATPAGLETLRTAARADAVGLRAAIAEARLSAANLPALVQAERLVLGMATEHHHISEAPPAIDPIAEAIVSDPEAMDAAIALLDAATKKSRSPTGPSQ